MLLKNRPKFYNSLSFKLTLFYSLILFFFTSLFVFGINLYLNLYLRREPPPIFIHNIEFEDFPPSTFIYNDLPQEEKMRIREIRFKDLETIQYLSVISLVPLAFASFLIGYYVAGSFLNPLTNLKIRIDNLKEKHLGRQIPIEFDDEIGSLVKSFNDMSVRLKKSFDSQTQFIEDASHELRTPLTVVQTNLDTALDDKRATKEELEESIRKALNGIKNMTRLTNYLLELSRPHQIQKKEYNLKQIIEEQIKMLKRIAENKNVFIGKVLSEKKVIRRVDKLMLGEAVYNLIDNSIKYSKDVKNPKVIITLEEIENKAVIKVWDNGIGIPIEHQRKIFDRFYRIDKSRSKITGGFGLGLAIVKKIVEDHGERFILEAGREIRSLG